MTIYSPDYYPADKPQFTAGANITGGQLVYLSANNTVSPTTGATAAWVGVAAHNAAQGTPVVVYRQGIHTIAASGAIGAGAAVIAASSGGVATIGSDDSDGANLVGVALSAAANNLVQILIR